MTNQKVKDYIQSHEDDLIEMRRYLHQHPEVSMEEYKTTDFVVSQLEDLGVDYKRLDPTGVIAEIKGPQPGKTVLLRADMDALPITQLNEVPYKSQNEGVMHACGHDTHTSMLLYALKALLEVQDEIQGTVRFIFQPAEETAEGAKLAIENGVLDGVDNAFGMHIASWQENGTVSVPAGPSFAAADRFEVRFQGKGGHAAQPHHSHDAVPMVAQFIQAVQTIVSRETDPLKSAVITIGTIEAGDRWNIIAENATLTGTVRSYDAEVRDNVERRLTELAESIASAHNGRATVQYDRLTDAVNNESQSARLASAVSADAFGEEAVQHIGPTMGGEDFGFYMTEIPGAFATVGSNSSEDTAYPHHHAKFDVDESSLVIGSELYAQYALAYLNQDEF